MIYSIWVNPVFSLAEIWVLIKVLYATTTSLIHIGHRLQISPERTSNTIICNRLVRHWHVGLMSFIASLLQSSGYSQIKSIRLLLLDLVFLILN